MEVTTIKYFIISGTSRGIGEAIAEKLISSENYLFCISRVRKTKLLSKYDNCTYFECDLNHIDQLESLMNRIYNSIDTSVAEGIYLCRFI